MGDPTAKGGESSILSIETSVSSANAAFGAVSGFVVVVTHSTVPVPLVLQPVGSAGAVTESKSSFPVVASMPVSIEKTAVPRSVTSSLSWKVAVTVPPQAM